MLNKLKVMKVVSLIINTLHLLSFVMASESVDNLAAWLPTLASLLYETSEVVNLNSKPSSLT
jgi:hypothetical protein